MENEKASCSQNVRVIPDLPAVSKEFDYIVPEDWIESGLASQLSVGSLVRIQFRNRSIGGWISEINPETETTVELQPLKNSAVTGLLRK